MLPHLTLRPQPDGQQPQSVCPQRTHAEISSLKQSDPALRGTNTQRAPEIGAYDKARIDPNKIRLYAPQPPSGYQDTRIDRHKRTLLSIPNHTEHPLHSPPTQPTDTPPPTQNPSNRQTSRPSLRLDRDEQRQLAPLADLAAEVRAAGANGRLIRSDDVGRRLRRVFETETLELTARCEPGRHHRTRKLVSPTGTSAPWPAEDELHGRDAVVRCLSGNPPPAPPSYHAVRDGLLWRWIDCPG